MTLKSLVRKPFRYRFFGATFFIIALNVIVYLLCNYTFLAHGVHYIDLNHLSDDTLKSLIKLPELYNRQMVLNANPGGLEVPFTDFVLGLNCVTFFKEHLFWQPFTYMFMHGGITHLLSNMIGLFFFGLSVEKALGSKEFILLYFISGVFSGLFSVFFYLFTGQEFAVLVGASGALYGILLAYAVIFPRSRIYIWGIIPVPAPILVLVYAGIAFFGQFTGSNISHMTHLAGFAFSWIYFLIRMGINPIRVWLNR